MKTQSSKSHFDVAVLKRFLTDEPRCSHGDSRQSPPHTCADAETEPRPVWHGSVQAPMVPSKLLLNI